MSYLARLMNPPTNILLITSDQQHYMTLGVLNPKIKTPNLDRLARAGVNFTRAYCPNPTCTPTRSSLLTGMWPSAHGAYTLGTKLDESVPRVTDLLHDAGYRTSLVGKAHFQPLKSKPDCVSVESYPTLLDLDFWRTFNDSHTPWYGFDYVEMCRNHTDEGHAGQHYGIWLEEQGLKDWRAYFQPRTDGQPDVPHSASKAPPLMPGPGGGMRADMVWKLPQELHYTHWTADRTIAEIERTSDAGQSFYCWSSFHDPHPPYAVPEPWASMYNHDDMDDQIGHFTPGEFDTMPPPHQMTRDPKADFKPFNEDGFGNHGYHPHWIEGVNFTRKQLREACAIYFGMISFMDHEIGRILDALDQRGLTDRTLVVFTSDHGHFLGQHGLVAKGPFHYEDVIRVPMIARWPGVLKAGTTNTAPQTLVDLPATFASAAGLTVPIWMQGRDMTRAWTCGTGRDAVIVENHHNGSKVHVRTVVTGQYKLTVYRNQPTWGELFDLSADPNELHNLYQINLPLRAEMMQTMVQTDLEREAAPQPRVWGA